MKSIASFLVVLLAATATHAADIVYPPGSRVGLVPPPDMVVARGLSGFRSTRNSSGVLIVEMPPAAYSGLSAGFGDEGLRAQNFRLKQREEVKVGTAPAILVTGEQAEGQRNVPKAVLLVAEPTVTALVIGQLPEDASAADLAAMAATLKTVAIRPALSLEEQIGALAFSIGNRAGFRPVRALAGNALLLTDGPLDVIQGAAQPVMIVAQSFGAPPPANLRDAFARQALVSNTFVKDAVVERSQSYRQGGVDWHEIVAKANETGSGVPVIVTQTVRFDPDSYIRAVGVVKIDARGAMLPRFRQLSDSLAPR